MPRFKISDERIHTLYEKSLATPLYSFIMYFP